MERYTASMPHLVSLEMTMCAKRYRTFAALRSFDSVLIFQISYFLTHDVFLRSG